MKPVVARMTWILLAAAAAGTIAYFGHPELVARRAAGDTADEVAMESLPSWANEALWIDARSHQAYETEHVPGALSLPAGEFDEYAPEVFAKWQDGQPVIVYCDGTGCDASRQVAQRLRAEMGLGKTYFLKGGWDAWKNARK